MKKSQWLFDSEAENKKSRWLFDSEAENKKKPVAFR